jgi:orotidine-5'-phosphate decarboxylase
MEHFADRLIAAIQAKRTPLIVGIDPRADRLPHEFELKDPNADFQIQANLFLAFSKAIIDVVGSLVPAIKLQSGFFERLGPAGIDALWKIVAYAQKTDLLVIMDAKRGDIGSTAEAYAAAYLGSRNQGDIRSAWGCDALTVSPFLGEDSLTPFVDRARQTGSGVFVLVKTSNPGSGLIQDQEVLGEPIYRRIGRFVQQLAVESAGEAGYGCVGAVVGATFPKQISELRKLMPNTFFLVPGFGAQGGTAMDVASAFDSQGFGAVVNSSRDVIFAYEREPYIELGQIAWQSAVRKAAEDAIRKISQALFD